MKKEAQLRDERIAKINAARNRLRKSYKEVVGQGALDGSQLDELEAAAKELLAAIKLYHELPG